jgi:hypothetical protein
LFDNAKSWIARDRSLERSERREDNDVAPEELELVPDDEVVVVVVVVVVVAVVVVVGG